MQDLRGELSQLCAMCSELTAFHNKGCVLLFPLKALDDLVYAGFVDLQIFGVFLNTLPQQSGM